MSILIKLLVIIILAIATPALAQVPPPQPHDPGPRGGAPAAGNPIAGLNARQTQFFQDGLTEFSKVEQVADGLGPEVQFEPMLRLPRTTSSRWHVASDEPAIRGSDAGRGKQQSAAVYQPDGRRHGSQVQVSVSAAAGQRDDCT